MSDEVYTIPRIRRVTYVAYANFPTTGNRIGDLAYATDRLVLYRWSGAAWQSITVYFSSGVAANIPTAGDLPNGSMYYTTDTHLLRQVQGGAWATINQNLSPTYGNYTGNGNNNHPIAHGLGVIPAHLIILRDGGDWSFHQSRANLGQIHGINPAGGVLRQTAIASMNTTNFYVGSAAGMPRTANENATVYYWTAFP